MFNFQIKFLKTKANLRANSFNQLGNTHQDVLVGSKKKIYSEIFTFCLLSTTALESSKADHSEGSDDRLVIFRVIEIPKTSQVILKISFRTTIRSESAVSSSRH